MISRQLIKDLTTKNQTLESNVVREYCQHLLLSYMYQNKRAVRILFKGGTALRIVFDSPRFSEDLDFTCWDLRSGELEDILNRAATAIMQTGIKVLVEESKETSGGYLAIHRFAFLGYDERIRIECSFRGKKKLRSEVAMVNSDYLPPFNLLHLPTKLLVEEKISALLSRNKPRDFYDVYFILRSNLIEHKYDLDLGKVHQKLLSSKINFKKELRPLLPRKHHTIMKDFRNTLIREIRRQGF